jgi:hypothetical protein
MHEKGTRRGQRFRSLGPHPDPTDYVCSVVICFLFGVSETTGTQVIALMFLHEPTSKNTDMLLMTVVHEIFGPPESVLMDCPDIARS